MEEISRLRESINELTSSHDELRVLAIKTKKQRDALEKLVSFDTAYIDEIKIRFLTTEQQKEIKQFELERDNLFQDYLCATHNNR